MMIREMEKGKKGDIRESGRERGVNREGRKVDRSREGNISSQTIVLKILALLSLEF